MKKLRFITIAGGSLKNFILENLHKIYSKILKFLICMVQKRLLECHTLNQ